MPETPAVRPSISCPLGITHHDPLGKFLYWSSLFGQDGHNNAKKELGQYPAILTTQAWLITHIYCLRACLQRGRVTLTLTGGQKIALVYKQNFTGSVTFPTIGHFWVPVCLCFKASLSKYENVFDLHENETACRTHFHMKGFALRLVLEQRHKETRPPPTKRSATSGDENHGTTRDKLALKGSGDK